MWLDNGNGSFIGLTDSSIDYVNGTLNIPSQFLVHQPNPIWALGPAFFSGPVNQRYYLFGWGPGTSQVAYVSSDCSATVDYLYGDALAAVTESFAAEEIHIDLTPNVLSTAVPGSVRFSYLGHVLVDNAGQLYADPNPSSGSGALVGAMDYDINRARITAWDTGVSNQAPILQSLRISQGRDMVDAWVGRCPGYPIQSLTFTIRALRPDGVKISASPNANGILSAAGIEGVLNYQTGVYDVRFGQWVDDSSNRSQPWYSARNVLGTLVWQPLPVFSESIEIDGVYTSRTASAQAVTGISIERLPPDGKLPKFSKGDMAAVHHTRQTIVSSPTPGATWSIGRDALDWVWIRDANYTLVGRNQFTCDESGLAAGQLVWAGTLDTTTYPLPWTVFDRIWYQDVIDDMDQWGRIVFSNQPITRTFPAGSYVSALLVAGDLQAKTSVPFFEKSWNGLFSDRIIGDPAAWAYDYLNFPILVTNRGATMNARVALVIRSVSVNNATFDCIVEGFGVLAQGASIANDFAPRNPATNVPFFTIKGNNSKDSPWGLGQTVGSAMVFRLYPSTYPVKMVKSLMPSAPTGQDDRFEFEFRGNVNRS